MCDYASNQSWWGVCAPLMLNWAVDPNQSTWQIFGITVGSWLILHEFGCKGGKYIRLHTRPNFTIVHCSVRFCVGGLSEDWRGALSHNPGAIFMWCFSVCEANPILSTNRNNFKGTTTHSWSQNRVYFCDAWLDGPLTGQFILYAHRLMWWFNKKINI